MTSAADGRPRRSPAATRRQSAAPEDWAPFSLTVRPDGEQVRLIPVGELDLVATPELVDRLAQVTDDGFRHVVIDLRELTFLDSSGLRAILDAHARSRQEGWTLRLIAGRPAVHRIFQITGTDRHLPFLTA